MTSVRYQWIGTLLLWTAVACTIVFIFPVKNSIESLYHDLFGVPTENREYRVNPCSDAIDQIYTINDNIRPCLQLLLESLYFRYVKIDLNTACPFWKDNPLCIENDCTVNTTSSPLLSTWRNISLGSIKFPTFDKEMPFMNSWDDNNIDFTLLENENSTKGVFVNLLDNPERYTGYSGHAAHQVWKAIYAENCFGYRDKESKENNYKRPPISAIFEEPPNACPEQHLFYKIISGVHTSISTHLSFKYLNQTTGEFSPNLVSYLARVGSHPNRIQNLYFSYMVLLRALQKLHSYLSMYPFETGDVFENQKARDVIDKVSSVTIECPNLFNERSVFQGEASNSLKREFRHHFRNISRIMDCVGCQKCRLWGKIQTIGIGTALKALFSYPDKEQLQHSVHPLKTVDYCLSKTEVVALMNTIGKFSESVEMIRQFESMRGDLRPQSNNTEDRKKKITAYCE